MVRTALVISLLLILGFKSYGQTSSLAPLHECTARSGLSNFLLKSSKSGASIRVAYLGGSITAQQGWRPKSLAYFRKMFPNASFTEINAAIGGTGSDLGVFRLQHDVLDKKPDLLFVEFAVNDGGAPPSQITRCMEGIVRQTWKRLPECDICFVYTVTESLFPPMLEGRFPQAASVMEGIADHYSIPSIGMAAPLVDLARTGKLLWKAPLPKTDAEKQAVGDKFVFAGDSVHPYPETGHELYMQAIQRSMTVIEKANVSRKLRSHKLPVPLAADNYERAKLIPLSEAGLSSGFVKLDDTSNISKTFSAYTGGLYRCAIGGETITFKFHGTYASIYDIIGPDCGTVTVMLDGQQARTIPRFDSFCTYHRLATLVIGSDLPNTVHTVKITVTGVQPDKLAILSQRNEKMDNPARFNDSAFYPGAILVDGDLVK